MNESEKIIHILCDILDMEPSEMTEETYIIRDLEAESIDLLELSVSLNTKFHMEMEDEALFLRRMREYLDSANADLSVHYPWLSSARLQEILTDLDAGPVLKIKDIAQYIQWRKKVGP